MNTLPSLSQALSGHTSFEQSQNNRQNMCFQKIEQPVQATHAQGENSVKKPKVDMFTPIKIIGKLNLKSHLSSKPGYAWSIVKKNSTSTDNHSLNEEKPQAENKEEELKGSVQGEDKTTSDGKDKADNSVLVLPESSSQDLIDEFQNKPWMQDPKSHKNKQKAVPDKKLAVRSDVVNKTLLRSLKRYYTSLFEEETKQKLSGKEAQKDELHEKLKAFTISIYTGDERFNLPEFQDVTMDDLVFYMGICINPLYMKKVASTPQERNKFHSFYNCLYKYSHKKLLKLFQSSVLHFMFRKFFEEGPFDGLLKHDSTLQRNPEAYKEASINFLNLFKQHRNIIS